MDEINAMLWDLLVGIRLGWESTCGTKVEHHSETLAREHADRINNGSRRDRQPYACVWCLHWHVGRRISKGHILWMRHMVISGQGGNRRDQAARHTTGHHHQGGLYGHLPVPSDQRPDDLRGI